MKAHEPKHTDWRFSVEPKQRFGRFFPYRKIDLNSLEKLKHIIWFFWFIVIATRVEVLYPSVFFSNVNMKISKASQGIQLPAIEKNDTLSVSNLHLFPIIIHTDASIKIDSGMDVNLKNLSQYLKIAKAKDPQLIVLFVVDKRCKMYIVNKVQSICIDNHFVHFRFMTSDSARTGNNNHSDS
jgi:hypothetical protein